jgi:hypothetical protein
MKKTTAVSLLTFCSSFVVVTVCLLLTPIPVYAAECSANCGGSTVTCYGATCSANDGVGCVASDTKGREV